MASIKVFNIEIGGWKFIGDRALNYLGRVVSLVNFILVLNINNLLGVDVWSYAPWFAASLIAGALFMVFDTLVILPQENKFCFTQNPVVMAIHKDVGRLEKEIAELKELVKHANTNPGQPPP